MTKRNPKHYKGFKSRKQAMIEENDEHRQKQQFLYIITKLKEAFSEGLMNCEINLTTFKNYDKIPAQLQVHPAFLYHMTEIIANSKSNYTLKYMLIGNEMRHQGLKQFKIKEKIEYESQE